MTQISFLLHSSASEGKELQNKLEKTWQQSDAAAAAAAAALWTPPFQKYTGTVRLQPSPDMKAKWFNLDVIC